MRCMHISQMLRKKIKFVNEMRDAYAVRVNFIRAFEIIYLVDKQCII